MAGEDNEQGSGKPGPKVSCETKEASPGTQYKPRRLAGITVGMPDSSLTPDEPDGEGIARKLSAVEYQKKAERQRRYFEDLADRVERGCPSLRIEPECPTKVFFELMCAAQAIRAYASQIPTSPPRGPGAEPKFDAGEAAISFIGMVLNGTSKFEAYGKLADEYGVSDTAVKKAVKKHEAQVELWLQHGKNQLRK